MTSDTVRRQHIQAMLRVFQPEVFIETGTSEGDTVAAALGLVPRIVSIELDEPKHLYASFRYINEPSVKLIRGDSDPVLERLVQHVKEPALFWLDAHFNGGVKGRVNTPIMREVVHIAHHRPNSTNIILIDDANLFGVDPTYPTLEWALTHYSFKDHYTFVYHDIIHALPKALFR